uniref:Uncharacterized protein n=2 Tax=Cacopsylla melanoneura TaxID=428564 RepID=A0A8D8TGL5_9HEMI
MSVEITKTNVQTKTKNKKKPIQKKGWQVTKKKKRKKNMEKRGRKRKVDVQRPQQLVSSSTGTNTGRRRRLKSIVLKGLQVLNRSHIVDLSRLNNFHRAVVSPDISLVTSFLTFLKQFVVVSCQIFRQMNFQTLEFSLVVEDLISVLSIDESDYHTLFG